MSTKAIGFDWGGVIHGKPGAYFNAQFAKYAEVSVPEFEAVYSRHSKKVNAQQLTVSEFWAMVLSELGRKGKIDGVEAAIATIKSANVLNVEMLELVDTLRENDYKVGLLSNNTQKAADRMRLDGIDTHFDAFIVSAEVGYMKPDPEIFELFAEELDVKLSELLFIDDSPKSLASADTCGFVPVLFTGYERLLSDFKQLGITLV